MSQVYVKAVLDRVSTSKDVRDHNASVNLAVVSRWEKSKNRNKLKRTKVKQSLFPLISDRHCHKVPRPFEFILYIIAILWLQLSIVTESSAYFVLIEDCSSVCYTGVSVSN